jgi:hypothetical protein
MTTNPGSDPNEHKKRFGERRTKPFILETYDAMARRSRRASRSCRPSTRRQANGLVTHLAGRRRLGSIRVAKQYGSHRRAGVQVAGTTPSCGVALRGAASVRSTARGTGGGSTGWAPEPSADQVR